MNEPYGLYVTPDKNDTIKRKLVTKSGTETVDSVSIKDELINFSARKTGWYLDAIRNIRDYACAVTEEAFEHNGEININRFDVFMAEVNVFLEGLEKEPIIQTLTLAFLEDSVKEDDGSAMFICEAMTEISYCIEELYAFKIVLNNIFLDYMNYGTVNSHRYPFLKHSEFKTIQTFDDTLKTQYYFRAPVKYYSFMLMQFLSSKPIVSRCENCGEFFVPKTKKKTLYCDRLFSNGKTCKEVAPKLKHKDLAANDPVIEAYDRTQRKMYKRLERALTLPIGGVRFMDYETYDNWLESAKEAKRKYVFGQLTAEEALAIIEVND